MRYLPDDAKPVGRYGNHLLPKLWYSFKRDCWYQFDESTETYCKCQYSDDKSTVFVRCIEFKELIPIRMEVIEANYPDYFNDAHV
jgi:hypothetical protein